MPPANINHIGPFENIEPDVPSPESELSSNVVYLGILWKIIEYSGSKKVFLLLQNINYCDPLKFTINLSCLIYGEISSG